MTSQPASGAELERQRAELAAAFSDGQQPPGQLYANRVTDTDVVIAREGDEPQLVVLFSHRDFPGVRFGHRCRPGEPEAHRSLMTSIEARGLHLMMDDPPAPDGAGITWTDWGARIPGIEHQRNYIETAFRRGWRAAGGRVITERCYAEARRVLDHGGWTGLGRATIDAVRNGAQPGDPLPAEPYIDHVTDPEVIITGSGPGRCVAVLFSYRDFPGVRFGHRFEPDDSGLPQIWLKEAIETGELDRMMADPPAPDSAGIIWTTWEDWADDDPAGEAQPG